MKVVMETVFIKLKCKGKRYNRETLEVKYKGKNIADVLDMTVEEALEFFENIPKIKNKIQTLYDVGLGYIKLRTTIYYIIRRRSTASKTCNRIVKTSYRQDFIYFGRAYNWFAYCRCTQISRYFTKTCGYREHNHSN